MENYAGFWLRFVAYFIDGIILGVVQWVLAIVMGINLFDPNAAADGGASLLNLISIVIGVAYFAGLESSTWQATVGKKALGLIVTDLDGNRISIGRAIGRYLGKILSTLILLIGFIMAGFTERKQGLHDMLAGTLVLKGQPGMTGTDPSVFS